MKRLLSSENEPVIKRTRCLISSSEKDQEIISNSSNECEEIIDDDDSSINSNTDDEETNDSNYDDDDEETDDSDHELIDLTEEQSNSSTCLPLKHDLKTSIDIEECPICLETFTDLQSLNIDLLITPCDHVLCTICIHQLLSTSSPRCPLCQKSIHLTTLKPYCILL